MIVPAPIRRGQQTSTPCDLLFLRYKKIATFQSLFPTPLADKSVQVRVGPAISH